MIDDLARWHKLDGRGRPAALAKASPRRATTPTGQLGITHGREPQARAAAKVPKGRQIEIEATPMSHVAELE
jgi:hypothetical protein